MYEDIAKRALSKFYDFDTTDEDVLHGLPKLAAALEKVFGTPIEPAAGESFVVSIGKEKTAALAFDRVYRIPIFPNSVPNEIAFYSASEAEIGASATSIIRRLLKQEGTYRGERSESGKIEEKRDSTPLNDEDRAIVFRNLCVAAQHRFGIAPAVLYPAKSKLKKEFPEGSRQVLSAAIENIALVDEQSLSWEQVVEFRKDKEAKIKYRRFVRWIDEELKARSPEEVKDIIAVRLDDYDWAVKKHGLTTAFGALSCLLDPKFLGATSAAATAGAIAGGGFWAALIGSALSVGRAALSFGTTLIDSLDERRNENYEVAYVHDIRNRFGE